MDSGTGPRALPRVGFPIRISRDHRLVSIYPGLFAAAHVLHRLLAPRHPPCALVLLIVDEHLCLAAMEFSRCTQSSRPPSNPRETVRTSTPASRPERIDGSASRVSQNSAASAMSRST